MIYADNAATTKPSKAAIEAMMPYLEHYYGNPSSSHRLGEQSSSALINARYGIKSMLGAKSNDELIFVSSGSEANAQAIYSAALIGKKLGKKRIISTVIEHDSVYNTLKHLEKYGFEVILLGVDSDGFVSPEEIEKNINDDTFFVSIMTANNEIGTVQPIREIGEICRKKSILFHSDAVQAVGHIKIDVHSLNVDMLTFSGHKFGGMKGVGALYVRNGVDILPLIFGGNQENGLRAGTENLPAIVATEAALKDSLDKLREKNAYLEVLRNRLTEKLLEIPDSLLNGSLENRLSGNVSVSFRGVNSDALLLLLDEAGICASKGSACKSASEEPSRVLTAIGREREYALGTVRFSLSPENTVDEIDQIAESVRYAISVIRNQRKTL